jgi:hypothetical protein
MPCFQVRRMNAVLLRGLERSFEARLPKNFIRWIFGAKALNIASCSFQKAHVSA